ncbi:MAG: hypothetical protein LBS68_00975 [Puniceicoccales bacterium]|nr:hypothetical protein [Puniceicoccales bacterium]
MENSEAPAVAPDSVSQRRPRRRRRNPIASNSRGGEPKGSTRGIGPCDISAEAAPAAVAATGETGETENRRCDGGGECRGKYSTALAEDGRRSGGDRRILRRRSPGVGRGEYVRGQRDERMSARGAFSAKQETAGAFKKFLRKLWPFGKKTAEENLESRAYGEPRQSRGGRRGGGRPQRS